MCVRARGGGGGGGGRSPGVDQHSLLRQASAQVGAKSLVSAM